MLRYGCAPDSLQHCSHVTHRRNHITAVLRQLHWLSVLVYNLYTASSQLATTVGVGIIGQRTSTYVQSLGHSHGRRIGDRSFTVVGLQLWNNLPVELRQRDLSFGEFRRLYLRCLCFVENAAHCDFLFEADVYKHTHLLTLTINHNSKSYLIFRYFDLE